MVKEFEFRLGEYSRGVRIRTAPPKHRHPVDAPGDDAAQRDAVCEAFGSREPDLLNAASCLQGLEESLDAPAPCIPAQLVDRLFMRRDLEVRDQLPEQRRSPCRRICLFSVDDLKLLVFITFLLSDRRPDRHRRELDRQKCFLVLT